VFDYKHTQIAVNFWEREQPMSINRDKNLVQEIFVLAIFAFILWR